MRVEYSLTTLGWSVTELLIALADWADEHMGEVDEARISYDRPSEPAAIAPLRLRSVTAAA